MRDADGVGGAGSTGRGTDRDADGAGDASADDLARIERGLDAAAEVLAPYTPGEVAYRIKAGRGDPVTEADHAVDGVLRALLPTGDDGWLSEETVDDHARLARRRVWIVDPIDGTREFVDGVPEWCVSIGLVVDGRPVAGGILNPATGERIVGGIGVGVTYGGRPVTVRDPERLGDVTVLASRSETGRGEWTRFADAPFTVRACGSVAYKLGLVGAGRATATWTLRPKSEWDVAAGAALVRAGGGAIALPDGTEPRFNRPAPGLPGFVAGASGFVEEILQRWLSE